MQYHYVYTLQFTDGMKYIGLHSTNIKPDLDTCYLGSGSALPKGRTYQTCKKKIVQVFDNRQEAVDLEIQLIKKYDAVDSGEFYNQRLKTHDKHGSSLTEEHKAEISKTQKGRSRVLYGQKYSGDGRTPAQKAGDKSAGDQIRGIKNPAKGLSGSTNNGFNPWYYITPEGVRVEVHSESKQDYAAKLGVTPRQLGHRFHYTNEHKEAKTLPLKGWTFGNL